MAFNCGNCFIPTCIAGCDTRSDMENAKRNGAQTTCDSRPIPKGKVIRKEYDIVCSLPLELLLEIVQYLEPAGVVGNQRVSKRWRSVFSSDTVIKLAMRQTLAFLGLNDTDVRGAATEATAYFRWRHCLQNGRPMKKVFLPWPQKLEEKPRHTAYYSRRLVYESADDNGGLVICMLDLKTGQRSSCWADV
ncbi:hypothetical protein VTN49DRAFT_6874 [Thermomyces lanuginosus]|uniref:uncharacterized protein n=1 Tax=Thermomyces lanuginosus TaxID=5541 RepID=UPI0037442EED